MKRLLYFFLFSCISSIFAGLSVQTRQTSISQRQLIPTHLSHSENVGQSAQVNTLSILAILVEFQEDDYDKTTGEGRFDLSVPDSVLINAPPHNVAYFSDQLLALSNYYRSVSKGRLQVNGTVCPQVFTLPEEMAFYNPDIDEASTDQGLASLFYDAIHLADKDGVQFSDYDVFFIFHAGVGKDINIGLDFTHQDIPSAFLNSDDLHDYLSPDKINNEGIPVQGGSFHIQEGIILPETESQEGYEIGLLGTMTLMFGFQLGLPALWNTETSGSGIGRWGLMDQGSGNYNGLIPAEPSAFSKVLLGWTDPIEVRQGDTLAVSCSKVKNGNQIYKIPVNADEYFLVENRQYDFNGDSIAIGHDKNGNQVRFLPSGEIETDDDAGVIIEIDDYDYGIPGSGILIWHIDETIIREKIKKNQINNDRTMRGVDLEEADGAQDIGYNFGVFSGSYNASNGIVYDAWYGDNEIHKLTNSSDTVAFTPTSFPKSLSNTGANSHIIITNFSKSDSTMTFSVTNDLLQKGFPVYLGDIDPSNHTRLSLQEIPSAPILGDWEGDQFNEIYIMAPESGHIAASTDDGYLYFSSLPAKKTDYLAKALNNPPVSNILSASISFKSQSKLVIGDLNSDDHDDLIISSYDSSTGAGSIAGYSNPGCGCVIDKLFEQMVQHPIQQLMHFKTATESYVVVLMDSSIQNAVHENVSITAVYNGEGALLWKKTFDEFYNSGLVAAQINNQESLVLGSSTGRITALSLGGQILWDKTYSEISNPANTTPLKMASGFLSENQFALIIIPPNGDWLFLDDSGEIITSIDSDRTPDTPGQPAIGDIDGDGFAEVVVTSGAQVWAYNHDGSMCHNFPTPRLERNVSLSSPVIGDLNEDNIEEIVLTTSAGDLEVYDATGQLIEGFPLSFGGDRAITPALFDLDKDGDIEIAAMSMTGYLSVWDLDGAYDEKHVSWGFEKHDPGATFFTKIDRAPTPLIETSFLPENRAYNYPNPNLENFTIIHYHLGWPATVDIRIYNLTGELVDSFQGSGNGPADNEVVWQLDDVESGVYFGQIIANDGAREQIVTVKIAVVK